MSTLQTPPTVNRLAWHDEADVLGVRIRVHFFDPAEADAAPDFVGAFGRVPVIAEVDGVRWETSVWRDKSAGWMLPVPKKVRRGKADGDPVSVSIEVDASRL